MPAPPAASTATDIASPTLSLPASQFAKLAPASFLAAHLPSRRPSGRTPVEARRPTLNTSSLTHAHGSAVVRVGNNAVVCGVRGEVVEVQGLTHEALEEGSNASGSDAHRIAKLGLLVPNIELATGCSPLYLPGNPPTALAQSLTHRALTLLCITDLIHIDDLQIWAPALDLVAKDGEAMDSTSDGEDAAEDSLQKPQLMAFWTLYIDILIMSLDGSPFDAVWGSICGALRNTRLPRAWWDRDTEVALCDPRADKARGLSIRGNPIAISFAAFQPPLRVGSKRTDGAAVHVLVDPDSFEESCCSQMISVVVDGTDGQVLRLELGGGPMLDSTDMSKLIERAGQRWQEWKVCLDPVP